MAKEPNVLVKKEINLDYGYKLIVRTPFTSYVKGDLITDPKTVKEIIESTYSLNVIKVSTSKG